MYRIEKKRKDAKNLRMYISVVFPNGQRHTVRKSTGTTDRSVALAIARQVHDKILRQGIFKEKEEYTLNNACGKYYKEHSKDLASEETDYYLAKQLVKFMGKNILLSEITDQTIIDYIEQREKTVSNKTIKEELGHLGKVLDRARDYWNANVFNFVRKKYRLPQKDHRVRFLSDDELKRLFEIMDQRLRDIVLIALYTGLRRGNILRLRVEDIDLKNNTIRVYTKSKLKGGKLNYVQIIPYLKEILERLIKEAVDGYLITWKGKPIKRIDTSFNKAVKRAKIQDFTFHDLRHTTATMVYKATRDIYVVKEVLKHSRIEQTMKYAHFFAEHEREGLTEAFTNDTFTNIIRKKNEK